MTRREIMPGVWLTCITTYKFKTECLSATFFTKLEKATASLNAVLPYVLARGTVKHPDMEAIAAALEDMYGARLEPEVCRRGEIQCVGFTAEFADGAFVPEGGLLEKTAALLGEVILTPVTSGGRLTGQYVEDEREKLMEDIRGEVNDKESYALGRLLGSMFRGESYAVPKFGTLRDAAKISTGTLTRRYRELISSSALELFYCGAENPRSVEGLLRGTFAALPRIGSCAKPYTIPAVPRDVNLKPRLVVERMSVSQERLALGYRLAECNNEAALLVFNALFGGGPASRLFKNVRERLGLCYYVDSSFDSYKGVLTVSAGVDAPHREEAVSEIERELESLREGGFDDRELETAQKTASMELLQELDDPLGLEDLYLDKAASLNGTDPEELASLVFLVERGDVIRIACCARLDTIYFLEGESDGSVPQ